MSQLAMASPRKKEDNPEANPKVKMLDRVKLLIPLLNVSRSCHQFETKSC